MRILVIYLQISLNKNRNCSISFTFIAQTGRIICCANNPSPIFENDGIDWIQ